MARKPDTPCSSCGAPMWTGRGSRPAKTRMCRSCRAVRRAQATPCGRCRLAFVPTGRGQRYCSRSCANVRPEGNPRDSRSCEICQATYSASYHQQRTCGRVCGVELRRREGWYKQPKVAAVEKWPYCWVYFADCPQCERLFTSPVPVAYCSDLCRSARQRALRRERERAGRLQRPKTMRSCGCGAPLSGRRQSCDACTQQTKRLRRARDKRRRRALKLGVASEPYTTAEIAARDGFACQLCDLAVDMALVVPDFWAPTIDHRMPLSAGGDDTRANVQLAHFICNSRKGAMVLEAAA